MKKFLNSVWGVALLCVIGAGLVVWRVVLPLVDAAGDAQFASMDEEDDWLEEAGDLEAVRHTLTAIDVADVRWNATPSRDPFAVQHDIDPRDLDRVQTKLTVAPRPSLDALVSGSSSKLAIIDGEVVSEGDRVAGYRVASIELGGVRLLNETNGVSEIIRVNQR